MYIEHIQHYFLNKKGKGLCLSPADCLLIDKWERDGIPLNIVYKGIDRTFKNFGNAHKDKVTSVYKCKNEIFSCWEEYKRDCSDLHYLKKDKKHKDNKSADEIAKDILSKINSFTNDLHYKERKAARTLPAEVSIYKSIEKDMDLLIKRSRDQEVFRIADIEDKIRYIIDKALRRIKEIAPEDKLNLLRRTAQEKVKDYKYKMNQDTYQETIEAIIDNDLKEEFGFSRFTVYS